VLAGSSLEDGKNPCQDNLIVHHHPFTCASAASTWGSQKVMSMSRYKAMAAASAARACSCWPLLAYSVPRPRWQWAWLERAHAQRLGQGEGLVVMGFSLLDIWGIVMRSDLAEEPECVRLMSAVLAVTGERESTPGKLDCFIQAPSQEIRLT
jgi:hypothetical protein